MGVAICSGMLRSGMLRATARVALLLGFVLVATAKQCTDVAEDACTDGYDRKKVCKGAVHGNCCFMCVESGAALEKQAAETEKEVATGDNAKSAKKFDNLMKAVDTEEKDSTNAPTAPASAAPTTKQSV